MHLYVIYPVMSGFAVVFLTLGLRNFRRRVPLLSGHVSRPPRPAGNRPNAHKGFRPAPPTNALCLLLAAMAAHTIEAGHTKIKT